MKRRTGLAVLVAVATGALTTIIGPASAVGAATCRDARVRPTRADMRAAVGATLCLVNRARRAHHLRPFAMNSALRRIAAGQSHDMLVGGYFGDNSLSGLTPMQRIEASAYARGASRIAVAQNIAWGEARDASPATIVSAWLASGPHREILLDPAYSDVGVGISPGTPMRAAHRAGAIYTLDLARR